MAEIEWKGATWKAAYGALSVKELLTILKGYGSIELLAFEKAGCFRGELSVALGEGEKTKEVTLYYLEVLGPRRKGKGRRALQWLREIFGGGLYVEDPGGVIRVKNANESSLPFWYKMFQEGLIDALEAEEWCLDSSLSEAEIEDIGRRIEG